MMSTAARVSNNIFHKTRISIANYKIAIDENKNKNKIIEFYPNYSIDNGIIDQIPKPRDFKVQGYTFKAIDHDISSVKTIIEKSAKAVGTAYLFVIDKANILSFSSFVTFCIVKIDNTNDLYGMTVLHLIENYSSKDYVRIIYGCLEEDDITTQVLRIVNNVNKERLNSPDAIKLSLNSKLKKLNESTKELIEIDDYYIKRINYLNQIKNRRKFFDAVSNIKPSPCFDFLLLNANSFSEYFKSKNVFPLLISTDINTNVNDGYLIGFNSLNGKINNSKGMTYEHSIKFLTLDLDYSKFLNPGKSISYCFLMKESNKYITKLFLGSTSEGSSGGPIVDVNGKLIGISFGYSTDQKLTSEDQKNEFGDLYFRKGEDLEGKFRNNNYYVSIKDFIDKYYLDKTLFIKSKNRIINYSQVLSNSEFNSLSLNENQNQNLIVYKKLDSHVSTQKNKVDKRKCIRGNKIIDKTMEVKSLNNNISNLSQLSGGSTKVKSNVKNDKLQFSGKKRSFHK